MTEETGGKMEGRRGEKVQQKGNVGKIDRSKVGRLDREEVDR